MRDYATPTGIVPRCRAGRDRGRRGAQLFPLVLGQGKRLLADGTIPAALRLVDSKLSTTGVVMGTYEPVGEVVTGSF